MSDIDWHGWSRGSDRRTLHIGRLPGRKSVCLYEQDNTTIRTLAFFKNEDLAKRTLEFLDHLTNAKESST